MNRFLLFSIFQFASLISFAQEAPPVFDWQLSLGGSSYDAAAKVLVSPTGEYIVVGTTNSNNGDVTNYHGGGDIWVVKLSASGAKQWCKTFGGSNIDVGVSALQLGNGNIIIAANTNSINGDIQSNHGLTDIWLLELNTNGTLLWQKTYGGSGNDVVHSLIRTNDGNLLIGGSSDSNDGDVTSNHGYNDFWLLKVNIAGSLLWQKSFGGSNMDDCNGVTEAADGGYLAIGNSSSNNGDISSNHGGNDYWIVKIDPSGNMLWEKSFGGSVSESALCVLLNSDGNFVIGGYSNSNDGDVTDNKGSSDFWMIRVDSTGMLLNQHTYGGTNSDVAYSIIQAVDGGYLLAGGTTSNNFDASGIHGSEDAWLLKTDTGGKVNWARSYGGTMTERALSAMQTSDGGFILAGYSYSNDQQVSGNHGNSDMWIAKQSCLSPVSSFTVSSDTVCVHSLVNFSNASINSAVYKWYADGIIFNSTKDVAFQFDSVKTYEISLIGATCYAKDTFNHTFTVIANPAPEITASKPYLCSGNAVTLISAGFIPGDILWSTGSNDPEIEITSGGTYSLIATFNQCSVTTTITIPELPSPQFSLGNDTSFCNDRAFTILAPAGYQSYLWQDGSTDSTFTTSTDGAYFVTVDNGSCSSTDTILLTIRTCIYPVAEFNASRTTMCENSCINFTDLSANATAWSWDFPGAFPSSSNVENPTNVCYSTPGVYKVTLTVSNGDGTSSMSRPNYIVVYSYPPVPTITVNGYSLTSSPASTYQWYGNGVPLSGATNQSFNASQGGYYYVVTGNQTGCFAQSDSVYLNITGISNYEPSLASAVYVYPNPANDRLLILMMEKWNSSEQATNWNKLQITGELGNTILEKNIDGKKKQIELSISAFANGIYYLRLESKEGSIVKKVVIAH